MFFFLSKVLWMVFSPMTFVALMLAVGFLTKTYRLGRYVLNTGLVLFIAVGFFPIGHNWLVYEENQYNIMSTYPKHVDGIIVLGGYFDLDRSVQRGQVQLNANASRFSEMLALAKSYPQAKMVFTGGDGSLSKSLTTESKELDKLLKKIGFKHSDIVFEGESRNTYENMLFSKELVKPKAGEVWLLVTSAYHMKRSEAIFRSNGWEITPYPAGYLTDGQYRLFPNLDVLGNMYELQIVAKEMIGIMAYTLTGKIKLNEDTNPHPISSGH